MPPVADKLSAVGTESHRQQVTLDAREADHVYCTWSARISRQPFPKELGAAPTLKPTSGPEPNAGTFARSGYGSDTSDHGLASPILV